MRELYLSLYYVGNTAELGGDATLGGFLHQLAEQVATIAERTRQPVGNVKREGLGPWNRTRARNKAVTFQPGRWLQVERQLAAWGYTTARDAVLTDYIGLLHRASFHALSLSWTVPKDAVLAHYDAVLPKRKAQVKPRLKLVSGDDR